LPRFRPTHDMGNSALESSSEPLFAAAFENAPNPMALIDPKGLIVQANRSLCRVLGFTRAELCALRASDIIHPDDAETEREQRKRLAAADIGRYDLVHRYLRKDLKTVWARMSVSAIRDRSLEPIVFVAELELVPPYNCAEDFLDHEVWFARLGDATLAAIHEIGNTLTALMLNSEMIIEQCRQNEAGQSADAIFKAARRIAFSLRRLRRLHDSQAVAYIGPNRLLDLRLVEPPALRGDSPPSEQGAA
jgi:PAS domain S-box-containing protein